MRHCDKKLSPSQVHALYTIREHGALDSVKAIVLVGRSWRMTMRSLERWSLVRYFPTPAHWKLTYDGKHWLEREDARRSVAGFDERTKATIASYRRGDVEVPDIGQNGGLATGVAFAKAIELQGVQVGTPLEPKDIYTGARTLEREDPES